MEQAAPKLPMPIRATPYRHQIDAFNFVCGKFDLIQAIGMASPGAALLMEMGTGKTITSIAVTGALYQAGKIRKVLVVAPLSILGVWDEEFTKFAAFEYTLTVLTGTLARKADTLRHMSGSSLQIGVINYESAWRLEKEITVWKPDLIIADEGHKIKNHSTSAAKAMHRLGAKAAYRLPTGSLKNYTEYLQRYLSKSQKPWQYVTRFSLKKAVNSGGITFSQASFRKDRDLTKQELAVVAPFAEQIKAYAQHVGFDDGNTVSAEEDGSEVNTETGEVIEPLGSK